ncbi:MAG: hypothetical protein A2Z83_05100 [Omnitrophica bacterium GWA2_52_8]|nr:MAG: hypothetical protein A2Z83_05100 [Omnitrophica bacterium GWA2_52_8]
MKVLHITTHLNAGGITNYILRLANPLRARGIEIEVLSSGGDLSDAFRAHVVPVHELPIRTKNILHPKLYQALPELRRLIKERGIDVIHAHTRIAQAMAFFIQFLHRIPVVTTCHGFYKLRLGRRLFPAWGDAAVAISQPVQEHLLNDFHLKPDKIRLIHNAVDLEEIDGIFKSLNPAHEKKQFGFEAGDFVVGIVARLVQDKGLDYLIDAVYALRQRHSGIRLLIVGDGNYREACFARVKKLGLDGVTTFSGNLLNADVIRALCAIDVFVLPATWREGFGLSIVEAMACKKPVIVTNIWSLNSLIQDHQTGILIEPKAVAPLAAAIDELMCDSILRASLGNQGRIMVEKFFSMPRMADELADTYQQTYERRHHVKKI